MTSNTGAVVSKDKIFSYAVPGSVATVTPSRGTEGTKVQIQGHNLASGGNKIAQVFLGGVLGSILNQTEDNVIVAAGPGSSSFNEDVLLISDRGAEVLFPKSFKYDENGEIHTVSPTSAGD